MAIDFSLAKVPVSTTAPMSGGLQMAMGMQEGAKAGVAGPLAQAQLQTAQSQGVLAQAEAAQAPQMAQMKQAMMSGAIKSADLENAMKTYTMAQNILAPSAMAAQQGDMSSAADIYERGVQALKSAGIDTAAVGAPDKFDPAYVKSAFANVSQQMAMAKQMLEMSGMQSNIARNESTVGINNARQQQIAYETGIPMGGSAGAFTYPGQASSSGSAQGSTMAGLTPKNQQALQLKRSETELAARASLADRAVKARSQEGLVDEGLQLIKENPIASGVTGGIMKNLDSGVQRLDKIYNDLFLGKVVTEFSGQGLGTLDESVSKTIQKTLPSINDFKENQVKSLANYKIGLKAVQMQNDIAMKLSEANVYDPNLRAQIGNQVAAQLGVKKGTTLNLENFKNAEAVTNKVLAQHGIKTETSPDDKLINGAPPELVAKLNTMGDPAATAAYLRAMSKKA